MNPVDIAFHPSKVYHLQRVTSHTVEGDRETTVVGTTISHYKVLEKIGQGGMGEVYLAEDSRLKWDEGLLWSPKQIAE